jgi:hypothetical protein
MQCAWKMQTQAQETGEDIRNSSQLLRILTEMAVASAKDCIHAEVEQQLKL